MPNSSIEYADGTKTEFYRILAWYVGDTHAKRIGWIINFYCRIMRLSVTKFWGKVP
jgi:hypothetical protein